MSFTGLDVFDRTINKTNIWLKEIMEEMGWEDRHRAYLALRSTLQTLRDRLTADEAVDLGAQLPMLVRGFYYEGWRPSSTPVKMREKREFLDRIRRDFNNDPEIDPEAIVRGVFNVISRKVGQGEITDIKRILPAEIADLWTPKVEKNT